MPALTELDKLKSVQSEKIEPHFTIYSLSLAHTHTRTHTQPSIWKIYIYSRSVGSYFGTISYEIKMIFTLWLGEFSLFEFWLRLLSWSYAWRSANMNVALSLNKFSFRQISFANDEHLYNWRLQEQKPIRSDESIWIFFPTAADFLHTFCLLHDAWDRCEIILDAWRVFVVFVFLRDRASFWVLFIAIHAKIISSFAVFFQN